MVSFSVDALRRLRTKLDKDDSVLKPLREHCRSIARIGVRIPTSGAATWGHYFSCPEDGARLKFDYACDRDFICPVCGRTYNGEPYLGAWWRAVNGVNTGVAYCSALLWALRGEEEFFRIGAGIVLGYADNYPNYEEHGDIPYNKPGRMNSQIICEAECLKELAIAYDMIADRLSKPERDHIQNDLLFPGAELLKKNRTDQLHNHEVIVNAALGVIGLVTQRKDFLDFALNSRYGLIYQLEHGVLEDGMWFESTLHYHFFALLAFMSYEKIARGTPYSLLGRDEYKRMYKLPLKLLEPCFDIPRLGDGGSGRYLRQFVNHYEFMYSVYGERDFAAILNKIYERWPREGLEPLFYGKEKIEKAELMLEDYHNDTGSGLTILRGSDKRQYLLFRHGRYGGEHDHYD